MQDKKGQILNLIAYIDKKTSHLSFELKSRFESIVYILTSEMKNKLFSIIKIQPKNLFYKFFRKYKLVGDWSSSDYIPKK